LKNASSRSAVAEPQSFSTQSAQSRPSISQSTSSQVDPRRSFLVGKIVIAYWREAEYGDCGKIESESHSFNLTLTPNEGGIASEYRDLNSAVNGN
jgi:hypothetical protein